MKKKMKSKGVVLSGEGLYIPIEFRGKGLNFPVLQVLSWVYGMYTNSGWVKISDSNLGNKLDLCRMTIIRAKQELQDLGLIKVTNIPGGVSEYEVNIERMGEYFNLEVSAGQDETPIPAKKENTHSRGRKNSKKQMPKPEPGKFGGYGRDEVRE